MDASFLLGVILFIFLEGATMIGYIVTTVCSNPSKEEVFWQIVDKYRKQ